MAALRTTVTLELPAWAADLACATPALVGDEERMGFAIELSRRNVLEGTGGPFGAAVFEAETGRLVGAGVNLVEPLHCSAFHAEVVAIILAQAARGAYSLAGAGLPACDLYSSCEPCAMCLGAIAWSGVQRVLAAASRTDAAELGFDEGPVFPQSYAYLEARGLRFVHGLLREPAHAALRLYARRHGRIYNATLTVPDTRETQE